MKKIGIIGAGSIAKAHAAAIGKSESARLHKVYDLSEESSKNFSSEFGCDSCDTVDKLFESVDAVIIATPNFSHYHYCALAIIKNIPVLCEKPLACSLKEAETMLGMATISKITHSIGFNYRYLPIIDVIKESIDNGFIGNIISIKLEFLKNSALRKKSISWRDLGDSNQTSGSFGDLGSHLIDTMLFLTGSCVQENSIRAMTRTAVSFKGDKQVEVDDNAHACCTLENGCFVEIRTSKTDSSEEQGFNIIVNGSKGDISYRTRDRGVYRVRTGHEWKEHVLDYVNQLPDPENEVFGWSDTFLHQINDLCSDKPSKIASFEDGYKVQNFIDRVIMLAEAGKVLHRGNVSHFPEIERGLAV